MSDEIRMTLLHHSTNDLIEELLMWRGRAAELLDRIAELEEEQVILKDQMREATNILIDKRLHIDSLYEEGYKLQQRIAELEAAQRWIPVSERLPEYKTPYDYVLVCDATDNGYTIAWRNTPFEGGCVWSFSADLWVDEHVTHWMPLPETPEVQE